jgi:hypothetical protein
VLVGKLIFSLSMCVFEGGKVCAKEAKEEETYSDNVTLFSHGDWQFENLAPVERLQRLLCDRQQHLNSTAPVGVR